MTNGCVGVATNGEGLDDYCKDNVCGRDDGSCAMMMTNLLHGMTHCGVCTKRKDNGIRMKRGEALPMMVYHQRTNQEGTLACMD